MKKFKRAMVILVLIAVIFFFAVCINGSNQVKPDRNKASSFKYQRLSYSELQRLKMLDEKEIKADLVYGYGKKAEGIRADLNGDGEDEIIIAGVTKIDEEEINSKEKRIFGADTKPYIKVIKPTKEGEYQLLWKTLLDGLAEVFVDIEIHKVDRSGIPKILVVFSVAGSTYNATDNVIIYYFNGEFQYLIKSTPQGPIEIKDLDGDGVEEIIIHETYNPDASMPDRILWFDVYEWTGKGLRKVNEKYPQFYKEMITLYEKIIEDKKKEGPIDELLIEVIKANQDLIDRAKEIIEKSKRK